MYNHFIIILIVVWYSLFLICHQMKQRVNQSKSHLFQHIPRSAHGVLLHPQVSLCIPLLTTWNHLQKILFLLSRVGILVRLRVIDPLFFLWTHKFQLKLTITCPLGRTCIHNGVQISHGKFLSMSHFCPPNYQNIELHILNYSGN